MLRLWVLADLIHNSTLQGIFTFNDFNELIQTEKTGFFTP